MKPIRARAVQYCAVFGACALPFTLSAQSSSLPDPSAPGTQVKPLRYESVFKDGSGAGARALDRKRLPWKRLFNADGSFVPEEALTAGGTDNRAANAANPQGNVGSAAAQTATQPGTGKDARGVVKAIYADRGKIKLKHGPIDRLEMPAMTMVFRVKDPSSLGTIKEGDELDFSVDLIGSTFVITEFEAVESTAATASPPPSTPNSQSDTAAAAPVNGGSDSRGVVKAIYADRNKVKLKHDPIDKLEMPAMTMVFRVQDPALLATIEEGKEVGFTVEMQGSAFVVTGFQP